MTVVEWSPHALQVVAFLNSPHDSADKVQNPADGPRRPRSRWPGRWPLLLVLLLGDGGVPARAQFGLPSLPGPELPSFEPPLGMDRRLERAPQSARAPSRDLRTRRIRELLRQHGDRIEVDAAGEPFVRSQVLAIWPSTALLVAARGAGFSVLRERSLAGLDMRIAVLRAPIGTPTVRALQRLRELDPAGVFDLNHVYMESGESVGARVDVPPVAPLPGHGASTAAAPDGLAGGRIGLIDGGVDAGAAVLRRAQIHPWGCQGPSPASPHGTAVASLMVGEGDGFRSAAPGLALYAADVYCGAATGGAVDAIAGALDWLAEQRVAVINISLVGPQNHLLGRLVERMLARGHLIVAAVGNDGPAAPPLYPAAYPGVIGVTGVDARRRVLPEAGRGQQVAFAAPGADLLAAGTGGYAIVRGTSFAAPLVAGLLAGHLARRAPAAGAQAIEWLRAEATDLGAPGPDGVFGNGLVGERLRVDPARLLSRRQIDRLQRGR